MDVIVERELHCKTDSGQEIAVYIKISKPRLKENQWYNDISMDGLLDNTYQVTGVDSFQSMCLAFGFVRNILTKFTEAGGTLLWSDQSGILDMDLMFS